MGWAPPAFLVRHREPPRNKFRSLAIHSAVR
jgi:hypothetical protein